MSTRLAGHNAMITMNRMIYQFRKLQIGGVMGLLQSYQLQSLIKFWEISNEPWGAKDRQSRFIYANRKYYQLLE